MQSSSISRTSSYTASFYSRATDVLPIIPTRSTSTSSIASSTALSISPPPVDRTLTAVEEPERPNNAFLIFHQSLIRKATALQALVTQSGQKTRKLDHSTFAAMLWKDDRNAAMRAEFTAHFERRKAEYAAKKKLYEEALREGRPTIPLPTPAERRQRSREIARERTWQARAGQARRKRKALDAESVDGTEGGRRRRTKRPRTDGSGPSSSASASSSCSSSSLDAMSMPSSPFGSDGTSLEPSSDNGDFSMDMSVSFPSFPLELGQSQGSMNLPTYQTLAFDSVVSRAAMYAPYHEGYAAAMDPENMQHNVISQTTMYASYHEGYYAAVMDSENIPLQQMTVEQEGQSGQQPSLPQQSALRTEPAEVELAVRDAHSVGLAVDTSVPPDSTDPSSIMRMQLAAAAFNMELQLTMLGVPLDGDDDTSIDFGFPPIDGEVAVDSDATGFDARLGRQYPTNDARPSY
ncbi:hypothetical protein K466DRAFT_599819 [Polyporus arcularius HHB13444]|uniref:HMG box domain-containing protein n=1 Tax=Polyporus arcularius HHB13444 TaxID=1314778 RepID=A0A5C3PDN5_9APHY|nr:hypothetical protein K466DRAFT_599819 [Polyporus arcularius HHB13444]